MADSDAPVTFIKKRKGAPSGLRKKPAATSSAPSVNDEPAASEVVHATKRSITSHLVQGTGSKRRRTDDAGAADLSDSEDEKEQERKAYAVRHSSDRQAQRRRSESPPAWVSSEQVKEMARDKNARPEDAQRDDGLYHGSKAEKHQVPKAFGPVKGGPANVRTITLVDYQPDVCKDYKETGFCGFGDTCKFLHDRGDYLHGWQLDNSFLSNSAASGSFMAKQRARDGEDEEAASDSENEDLPFACLICRKPFGPDPVVTLCGHYFDSACAIKRFAKTGKCFACGASTNGVFNRAKKLIDKQKEREELNKKAQGEEEEGANDDGGIEIEGLGDGAAEEEEDAYSSRRRRPAPAQEDDGEYEEEEEEQRPRRRPIIEIQ
ncbi:hypothetical protein JCM10213_007301 [Rhodosporidiobolus nylandii]